jgi:hypothetical protein
MEQEIADLHSVATRLAQKRRGLVHNKNNIKLIALGSSHGECGFNPALFSDSYNLCTYSQDLYYSRKLYDFTDGLISNLEMVVIFYSAFSCEFNLCLSGDKYMPAAMKHVFGVDFSHPNPEIMRAFSTLIELEIPETGDPDHMGFFYPPDPKFFPAEYTAERRAKDHVKFSELERPDCMQHAHLIGLIDASKRRAHRLCIVIPPARSDYRRALPLKEAMFNSLYKIGRDHEICLLDLFDDPEFSDDDFADFDHLHPWHSGPVKLAEKVRSALA